MPGSDFDLAVYFKKNDIWSVCRRTLHCCNHFTISIFKDLDSYRRFTTSQWQDNCRFSETYIFIENRLMRKRNPLLKLFEK